MRNYSEDTVDIVRTFDDGTKKFYVVHEVAGIDEDGYYEVVLDGPAQGEKAYV